MIHKNLCTKRAKLCRTQVSTSIPVKLSCFPNKSLETPKICIGCSTWSPLPNAKLNHTLATLQNLYEPQKIMSKIFKKKSSPISPHAALQLLGQLPSGPITTGHPGTQSFQAKSSRVVVSQGTTPQSSCLPINYPSLVEAQATEREENTPRKQCLAFTPAISPKCAS